MSNMQNSTFPPAAEGGRFAESSFASDGIRRDVARVAPSGAGVNPASPNPAVAQLPERRP